MSSIEKLAPRPFLASDDALRASGSTGIAHSYARTPRHKLLISLFLLAIMSGCHAGQPGNEASVTNESVNSAPPGQLRVQSPHIRSEEVAPSTEPFALHAPGVVVPQDGARVAIISPVEGRVVSVHVTPGQRVDEGALLATVTSFEASNLRSELRVARSQLRMEQDHYERQQRLAEAGVGIERELVTAQQRLIQAQVNYERADSRVQLIDEGRAATVTIRAPRTGVITRRYIEPGASVGPELGELFELVDLRHLWFRADVFEHDIEQIEPGVGVVIENLPGIGQVTGTITRVSAILDGPLRRIPVYIELHTQEASTLRPGMSGRARFELRDARGVQLPTQAILLREDRQTIVYIEEEAGVYTAREVDVTRRAGGVAQIRAGLSPGERVVVEGALLVNGAADALM